MTRSITFLSAAVAALLISSCSWRFNHKWTQALASEPAVNKQIEGCWEGRWNSVQTGHSGRLRCIVGPALNEKGDHPFHYHAAWGRFFSGTFQTTQRVTINGNGTAFHGEQKLPSWAGGTYIHDGTAKDGRFSATYRCAKDHGSFEMTRPTKQ